MQILRSAAPVNELGLGGFTGGIIPMGAVLTDFRPSSGLWLPIYVPLPNQSITFSATGEATFARVGAFGTGEQNYLSVASRFNVFPHTDGELVIYSKFRNTTFTIGASTGGHFGMGVKRTRVLDNTGPEVDYACVGPRTAGGGGGIERRLGSFQERVSTFSTSDAALVTANATLTTIEFRITFGFSTTPAPDSWALTLLEWNPEGGGWQSAAKGLGTGFQAAYGLGVVLGIAGGHSQECSGILERFSIIKGYGALMS